METKDKKVPFIKFSTKNENELIDKMISENIIEITCKEYFTFTSGNEDREPKFYSVPYRRYTKNFRSIRTLKLTDYMFSYSCAFGFVIDLTYT